MRFFSNDSDDSRDQSNVDVQARNEQVNADQAHDDAEHPDHVQSDPVAVPQQRSGSPWSNAPGSTDTTTDAEVAEQERRDDEAPADSAVVDDRDPFAGPGENEGAAHRDDDENRDDDTPAGDTQDPVDLPLDDRSGDDTDAKVSDTDVNTDPESSTTTTYGPDGTVVTHDTDEEVDSAPAASDADTEADVDRVDGDRVDGDRVDGDRVDGDPALKDEGDFDDPTAVDPATDKPLDNDEPDASETTPVTDSADTDDAADSTTEPRTEDLAAGEPVPVPVGAAETTGDAAAAKPGSVNEPELGSLFGEADAQSFQERWRDVQLQFVDSPQDATTEAAALVDEAVDKLTASLKAQKDTVSGESDDTEQLRVALRGYRDILNRVLGL